MSKTKYIKVPVSERLPNKEAKYLARVSHYSGFEFYAFSSGEFRTSFLIEEWLEEVPDREDDMVEMLEECRLQLEYLNNKTQRGTSNSILSRLNTLLNSIK